MLMLRTSGDKLQLQTHQSCTNFPKIKEPSNNFNIRVVTESKPHTEGPQLLGASGRNSATFATPLTVICSPLRFRCPGLSLHYVQKDLTCITLSGRCQICVGKCYFMFSGKRPYAVIIKRQFFCVKVAPKIECLLHSDVLEIRRSLDG
jgi:hypothetical protein